MNLHASVWLCVAIILASAAAWAGEAATPAAAAGVGFARITLRDVQGLWGGHDLWLDADGKLVVQAVRPADRDKAVKRYAAELPPDQVAAVDKLVADHKFFEIEIPKRPGVPDEAHPAITVRMKDGRSQIVGKWANDKHADFDAIYSHLLGLAKAAQKGEPVYIGPHDWKWEPPAGGGAAPKAAWPFFALCMDTHDAKKRSLKEQAELLKELGYDGCAHLWLGGVPERLKTLDDNGLKLFEIYVTVNVAPGKPAYDPHLKDVIKLLKGRDTTLGLLLQGLPPSTQDNDPHAVEILREIADMAQESGIRVAIYHHLGDWTQRFEDAVRVAKKVDRKNVGVHFNLCHWLKMGDESKMEALLKDAMPVLFVVTLNGADHANRALGWDRLIQPLDRGEFDVYNLLRMLKGLGYTGPIGLMCYGLGGDARDHLSRSMDAWRKLSARLAAEPK